MKQFRPHRFPPLAQVRAMSRRRRAGAEEAWQGAVADGYRQGSATATRPASTRAAPTGFPLGHAEGVVRGAERRPRRAQA